MRRVTTPQEEAGFTTFRIQMIWCSYNSAAAAAHQLLRRNTLDEPQNSFATHLGFDARPQPFATVILLVCTLSRVSRKLRSRSVVQKEGRRERPRWWQERGANDDLQRKITSVSVSEP